MEVTISDKSLLLPVAGKGLVQTSRTDWIQHIRGLEPYVEPDDGKRDENGVIRFASWFMENFWATRLVTDCFDAPEQGGRGWCPKLAEVDTFGGSR